MKGFKGGANWTLFESNSMAVGNLLPDSPGGVLCLSVIGGSDKMEQVEGEGETGEDRPRYICLSIRCLYPSVGDGGGGGKWNGIKVTGPSLVWTSGGEVR